MSIPIKVKKHHQCNFPMKEKSNKHEKSESKLNERNEKMRKSETEYHTKNMHKEFGIPKMKNGKKC